MVRIKKKLYTGLTHPEGFTCGFAFESAFNLQTDVNDLMRWLEAKGFFDFGVVNMEHLMFKDPVQAEEFKRIYPILV